MNRLLVLVLMLVLAGGCVRSGSDVDEVASFDSGNASESSEIQQDEATIVIDDGMAISTVSASLAEGMTAFEGLEYAAQEYGYELSVTEYDFGVMVDAVNGMPNTEDLSWIYFVNGNSGSVGADQYQLNSGDALEWKYIKPIF